MTTTIRNARHLVLNTELLRAKTSAGETMPRADLDPPPYSRVCGITIYLNG